MFLDGVPIVGWTAYLLPLENIEEVTSRLVGHRPHVEQRRAPPPELMRMPGISALLVATIVAAAPSQLLLLLHHLNCCSHYVNHHQLWCLCIIMYLIPHLPCYSTAIGAAESATTEGPSFYRGWLDVDEPADTFVSLRGWSKGVFFINGFNLGRYWPVQHLFLLNFLDDMKWMSLIFSRNTCSSNRVCSCVRKVGQLVLFGPSEILKNQMDAGWSIVD